MNLMNLVILNAVSGLTPDYSWMANRPARLRTPEEEAKLKDPKIQAYLQRQQKEAEARAAMAARKTGTVANGAGNKKREDYAANFAGMNFTDDEKKFITEAGFDPTNARSVQEFILSRNKNANLGARKGAGIADGYWGDESIKAFNALRSYGTFKPKAEPVVDKLEPVKPVSEVPVDAPDFGYATNQDYSNGKQFKNLGFNNYQGLLRYAQGSQDQFAQDLRQRFGDKLTDQAYVESQLGISGKYRGGSAGDFGDIARSMQAWKTNVNQQFDNNRAAYAKKQLDARTGSNGTVYSSADIKDRFEKVNVSPEIKYGNSKRFDFSNMKFNNIFGTTGAQTLGGTTNGFPTSLLEDPIYGKYIQ